MSQPFLFTPIVHGGFLSRSPAAATADPITSHLAAEAVTQSGLRDRQALQVLEAVRRFPGKTSRELAAASGLDRHMCGRRLGELRSSGLVRNGETRVCAVSGMKSLTWIAEAAEACQEWTAGNCPSS